MDTETEEKPVNGRQKIKRVLLALAACAALFGGHYWYKGKVELTTDDAFVECTIQLVSARVPGQVSEIAVTDNQAVQAGDLLLNLDPAAYQAKVDKAEAALAVARNGVGSDEAAVAAARAGLTEADARLQQAENDRKRGEALYQREVLPKERLEQLQTAARVAAAAVEQARQQLKLAESKLGKQETDGERAKVAERRAELATARLNLDYTRVVAAVDGVVTRKSVQVGNNVQAGQPLLALVQLDAPWIVANFKESQLAWMEPGQKVEFSVDAYPGRNFSGRVDSIMAGTGAAFALLPPENATGNYVKVVQRVPVKIVIDADSDPQHVLRAGMSVVPTVNTGRSFLDVLGLLNPFH